MLDRYLSPICVANLLDGLRENPFLRTTGRTDGSAMPLALMTQSSRAKKGKPWQTMSRQYMCHGKPAAWCWEGGSVGGPVRNSCQAASASRCHPVGVII